MLLNRVFLSDEKSSALFSEVFNKDSQTNKNRKQFMEHLNENVRVSETETGYITDFADLDLSFLDDEDSIIQDTFQYVSECVYKDSITYTIDKSQQISFYSYSALHMNINVGQVTSKIKCEKAESTFAESSDSIESPSYCYVIAA